MVTENRRRAEIIKKQAALKRAQNKDSKLTTLKKQLTHAKKELLYVKLFLKRSTKPSRTQYLSLLRAHTTGVLLLGFLGYIVTFIHIPINSILFGAKQ
ncbi:protein transport protein SEC61 subunit gamma [Nematocida sp. AWRm80]|nr:protein transport protein SEC61 subunit gamma [Nematocida sp. AWRm80]